MSVILQRIRKRIDEVFSEEQAGFKICRSTVDQIFVLRQLAEKFTELNRKLCASLISQQLSIISEVMGYEN